MKNFIKAFFIIMLIPVISACSGSSEDSGLVHRYSRQELIEHKKDYDSTAKTLDKLRDGASGNTESTEISPESEDSGDIVDAALPAITVFVTKTGTKYHTADCPHLKKSKIEISIEEAKAGNFTPCTTCNPG